MVKPSTPQRYLYAIADASQAGKWGNIGINGALVTTIIKGPVAAVVSGIAAKRVRPERANLASHNGVIKLLMQESTVLPVAFGTIADRHQAVEFLLSKNSALLVEQLDSLRGKVEMGLRVRFDVPNIFEYIVSTNSDLKDSRDTAYGGGAARTQARGQDRAGGSVRPFAGRGAGDPYGNGYGCAEYPRREDQIQPAAQ